MRPSQRGLSDLSACPIYLHTVVMLVPERTERETHVTLHVLSMCSEAVEMQTWSEDVHSTSGPSTR